jgi:outer membrane protein assembly factor BamB
MQPSRLSIVFIAVALAGCGHAERHRAFATLEDDPAAQPVLSSRWKLVLANRAGDAVSQEFASAAAGRGGHRLFVGSHEGTFYALEASTGDILWDIDIGSVSSRALVSEGRVYVGTDDGVLHCLDSLDGSELWRYESRAAILEPPVAAGDSVFFTNEADQAYAVDRKTGKFRWQYKSDAPEDFTLRGHAGIAVGDDVLFTGFSNGSIVALRIATGTVAWMTSLSAGKERARDVDSTPLLIGDAVIATSSGGGVYSLDSSTGRINWRLEVEGAGSVSTDGSRLFFVAAELGAYAIDLAGHILWRQGTKGGGEGAMPVVTGDYVMYSLSEAGLFIADKKTGAIRQYFDPGFGVSAPPTVIGDSLYVISNGTVLYAMSVRRF